MQDIQGVSTFYDRMDLRFFIFMWRVHNEECHGIFPSRLMLD